MKPPTFATRSVQPLIAAAPFTVSHAAATMVLFGAGLATLNYGPNIPVVAASSVDKTLKDI
jgi:hypothetical protein